MEINEVQRQAVRDWVAAGATLSEVQKRLKEEFNQVTTFMETRLLVLELGAAVKDKPEPAQPKKPRPVPAKTDAQDLDDAAEADDADLPPNDLPPGAGSRVRVSLDKIVPAGAMISGSVVFSDGTQARWQVDRMGRLALDGPPPEFRPSAEDVREFQVQLQSLVAGRG
jgi:hypothetical protein